jgi:hypothetical protein
MIVSSFEVEIDDVRCVCRPIFMAAENPPFAFSLCESIFDMRTS